MSRKINPFSKTNPDTGFGTQATQFGGRFINRDGSFNLRKEGLPFLKKISFYSYLLTLPRGRFLLGILLFYIVINTFFTCLYMAVGFHQLQGLISTSFWGQTKEVFFFSTETFTTVGYGRINPIGDGAHIIASLESMTGFLSFAVFTGLIYGRFTRPKAYVSFSDQALVGPYKDGVALMFRMVPYKNNHHLTNAQITVTTVMAVGEGEKPELKFYPLKLERSRIDSFTMNWTIVHPMDEDSPFLNFTQEDMERAEPELYILVTGFDQVFSNTVMRQTSYTHKEIVWGAKFKPMYHESEDGTSTIVELDKLHEYEKVQLPVLSRIEA